MRKPDSEIEISKSACWETYFLSCTDSVCLSCGTYEQNKASAYKKRIKFLVEINAFSKNKLQSRHSQDPEKLYCEHIQP